MQLVITDLTGLLGRGDQRRESCRIAKRSSRNHLFDPRDPGPTPAGPSISVYLAKCGPREQTELMRVVVTQISQDGTMRRRMVDTAVSGDVGPWEELAARA